METVNGAQLLIRLLQEEGVTHIAGIPGGAALPIYDALAASTIHHVLARHEQGAGFIAQGFARASGQVGVCLASSGPGATNLITPIADAKLDSIPLVCITAQVPQSMIGTDAFQEVDTYGLSIPITKHNYLVRDAHELYTIVPRAFELARDGRPGPVWIDIPKDVQLQLVGPEESQETVVPEAPPPILDKEPIRLAAERINAAERPILYLGGGVVSGGAAALAIKLAEKASLPTTQTLMALGCMPMDHPLSLGMLGMHGARYTNYMLEEADLLIVIGARFDDRAIGKAEKFCPRAAIIHVDIDPSELGKIKMPHLGICGDVYDVLQALMPQVQANERKEWRGQFEKLRERYPLQTPGVDDIRSHYGLIHAVASYLDDDAFITTDVGQHQMWVAQTYPLRRARQWLTSGGLGTMGFGFPAAIGAALAKPEQTVVCFSGDGSLKMNIQEMATAVEQNLNVKIVLMNNQSLGMVHQQQDMFYKQGVFASDYRVATDFCKVAEGFGMQSFNLDETDSPHAMLEQALKSQGPCLIHCSIDASQRVLPMVPPGAANTDMIGG